MKQSDRNAKDAKYYEDCRTEYYNRLQKEQRVNSALRGVITKIKHKDIGK